MKYLNIFSRMIPFFFFYLAFCRIPFPVSAESVKIIVYFYSSETNINNLNLLKTEFDSYFSGFGPYEFQPVKKKEEFEKYLSGKTKSLFLLSSWHYNNIHQAYFLRPVLVGLRDGQRYQKRILVGKGGSAGAEDAKTAVIASATSIVHTKGILGEIFKNEDSADGADILTVPKDIDALMSVSLGMSQYALTTENSLETLKNVHPQLYKDMKIVAEGKNSLLLIMAFSDRDMKEDKDILKLIEIIQNMPLTPEGKNKIKMFGLDGWQRIDSPDDLKTEAK